MNEIRVKRDNYLLKHGDVDVAEFCIDKESNTVDYFREFEEKFSPVNTKASEAAKPGLFNGWLENRCIPGSRNGVERLKHYYNMEDLRTLMILKCGLSLSDHYWIDRKPFDRKWKEINLFENRYDEVVGKIVFDKKTETVSGAVKEMGSPVVTTGGSLDKYWVFNEANKKSYLVKGGSGLCKQEPFNERYAHLLLNELNIDHTEYVVEKVKDMYVSVCSCIADMNTEMISALDIRRKYGIEGSYVGFVDMGKKKGCVDFEHDVNKMIVLDYLIDNTDRHWNNFGILRNSKTGSWKGSIPLFDNGYSLWNNDVVTTEKSSKNLSFAEYNDDCLKFVVLSNYIKKLPDMSGVFENAFEKYEFHERKWRLKRGVCDKMEEVKRLLDCGDCGARGKKASRGLK